MLGRETSLDMASLSLKTMIHFIKSLFKLAPPLNKWIDYDEYCMDWDHWRDRVTITDYDKRTRRLKLRLLSDRERFEAEIRNNL